MLLAFLFLEEVSEIIYTINSFHHLIAGRIVISYGIPEEEKIHQPFRNNNNKKPNENDASTNEDGVEHGRRNAYCKE